MGEVTLRPFYIVKVTGKGAIKHIYIPSDIQKLLKVEVGDYAEITVDESEGVIRVRFIKPRKLGGG